jgi:ABC-type multidrug transport system ATPase subunit
VSRVILLLEVDHLSKTYKEERGLKAAGFNVEKGELIALVGHNGAGKSTLLKMLAGWLVPDSGTARIDGIDLKNRRALVRKIGFVPETPNLFDLFSARTYFRLRSPIFRNN